MASTITMVLASLAAFLVVFWLSSLLWIRHFRLQRRSKVSYPLPPGSFGIPFVGETIHWAVTLKSFFLDRVRQHGQVFKTHLLGHPTVFVSGPEAVASLFQGESSKMEMSYPKAFQELFGSEAILCAVGDTHAQVKRRIAEALTPSRLADFVPCIQQSVRSHLTAWCSRQGPILGYPACGDLVCDIVLELLLGCSKDSDAHGRVRRAFIDLHDSLIALPVRIPGLSYDQGFKAKQEVIDFVREKMQTKSDKDYTSVLDVLSEDIPAARGGMSPENVAVNILNMMVAASGTTSSTMSWTLLLLARHPEVQDRLKKELQDHGLLSNDCPEELTYEIVKGLPLLKHIIKEVLRFHPPAEGGFRKAKNTLEVNGYQIPKDWKILFSIRETHKVSASAFENPGMFQPSRWQDGDIGRRLKEEDLGSYLPFGLGSRLCPGKDLAILVLSIFLIEMTRLATYKVQNLNPGVNLFPIQKPADDLPMTFKRAQQMS